MMVAKTTSRGQRAGRGDRVKARQSEHGGHCAHAPTSQPEPTYLSWMLIARRSDPVHFYRSQNDGGFPFFSVPSV